MRFDNGLAIEKPFLHDYLPTWFQQYDQELEKNWLYFYQEHLIPKISHIIMWLVFHSYPIS